MNLNISELLLILIFLLFTFVILYYLNRLIGTLNLSVIILYILYHCGYNIAQNSNDPEAIKMFYLSFGVLIFSILATKILWDFFTTKELYHFNLKKFIANNYIIFFVGIVNHQTLNPRFVVFITVIGLFITRQAIRIYKITYPYSIFFLITIPLITLVITIILLVEIFKLAFRYPKFGTIFVNFFKKHASSGALILVNLKPPLKNKDALSGNRTSKPQFHNYRKKNNQKKYFHTSSYQQN